MYSIIRDDIDNFVFISDIHLGCKNASIEWSENIVSYFKNFFIPILEQQTKCGKTAVIIAGDFFDNRQNIDINIMNIGANIMEEISKICEVFILIGNHDIYKKSDIDISSTRIFKYFNNVKVIDDIAEILCKDNIRMTLIPWIGDHKKETEIISEHADSNFIVMHASISGMSMDNGREILDGANPSVIKNGMILSGHIHKRQESKKVIYFGSPYQMRRSDIGNDKGLYILHIENKPSLTYVQNTYSPKFLRLNLLDILDKDIDELKTIVYNNYVDIIIKKRWMNDISVSKLMEIMDQCQVKKIEIILDKDDNIINDKEVTVNKDMTITDVFNSRLNSYSLSDNDIQYLNNLNNSYLKLATDNLGLEDTI